VAEAAVEVTEVEVEVADAEIVSNNSKTGGDSSEQAATVVNG
jgi:hypothetical protein